MSWSPPEPDPRLGEVETEVHGGPGQEPRGRYPPVRADLSTNVNPWLPDDALWSAVSATGPGTYPDPESRAARTRLAETWTIGADRILLGAGGSELIYRIARCWVRPGDRVVVCGPTFGEYRRAALLQGGRVCEVRAGDTDLSLPLERFAREVRATRPPLAFLCTPNNPTGEALADDAVEGLARRMPSGTLLVVDESYRSFAKGRLAPPHLPESDRVLHLRSFTKDLGVPGLRIGAAIGAPRILDSLARAAPPWPVSSVAQAALTASLDTGALARLERTLARIRARREELAAALAGRGWQPLPSVTSFVLSAVPAAADTTRALRVRGVRVRHAASFGLPGHIRVAVRPRSEEERLLTALDEIGSATITTGGLS